MICLENEYGDIKYRDKNSVGQTMQMTMEKYPCSSSVHWWVSFWVNKKCKGYERLQQTGRNGLSSLIWAKKCLVEFMDSHKDEKVKQYICIGWDNGKRRDVYVWALKGLGFEIKRVDGVLCLCKSIN